MSYVIPSFDKKAFNCPNCGAYSQQVWQHYFYDSSRRGFGVSLEINKPKGTIKTESGEYSEKKDLSIVYCYSCEKFSVWLNELMISPSESTAPIAEKNMPANILDDYNEARSVLSLSPKSSCALLRLALQKLCVHLGGEGKNINADIKFLVKQGLPERIQKSLDAIRIVGNSAVHPGEIEIDDDPEIANSLFKLINIIVDYMITQPLEINAFYDSLPESSTRAVARRDSN